MPTCCFREKINPIISDKRIENVRNAFPEIDFTIVHFGHIGIGDKPELVFHGDHKNIKITYRTQTPGGGYATIYWLKRGIYYYLRPAALKRAVRIMGAIKGDSSPWLARSQKVAGQRMEVDDSVEMKLIN